MLPISVIIPCYRSSDTIERAVSSVVNQTKLPYEIILIDDFSNDGGKTINLIKNIKLKYSSILDIVLVCLKENKGVASSRNRGIELASQEYIAFLDSDDEWDCDKLEKQMEVFVLYSEIGLVGTNRNGEYFKKFFFLNFDYITSINLNVLLFKNFYHPSCVMIKKEVIDNLGVFNEKKRYGEDTEFFQKISLHYRCLLINESLVICDRGKPTYGYSGLSANLVDMEKEELGNFNSLYKNKKISLFLYLVVSGYSILKFFRRVLLSKTRSFLGGCK